MGRDVPKRLVTSLGGVFASSTVQLVTIQGGFEAVEDGGDEGPELARMVEPAGKKLLGLLCKGVIVMVSEKSRQGVKILSLVLV